MLLSPEGSILSICFDWSSLAVSDLPQIRVRMVKARRIGDFTAGGKDSETDKQVSSEIPFQNFNAKVCDCDLDACRTLMGLELQT